MSTSNLHARLFGFVSVFLTGLGVTLLNPVVPFLVARYTTNPTIQTYAVTAFTSLYSLAVFVAAPFLGQLSDRYGRRPILIGSLIGSAIGYLLVGVGGALWVLFLGRLIEGLTAGEISTLFAYFADTTLPEERTKYFGWMSAIVGIGTTMGPLIGGFLAQINTSFPLYAAAFVSLVNALYGYFFMQESHPRSAATPAPLHVFPSFKKQHVVPLLPVVKRFFLLGFFLWLPSGALQALFAQFSHDSFAWTALLIGSTFSLIGILDILSQIFVMPWLLKFCSDRQILQLSLIFEGSGYLVFAAVGWINSPWLFVGGICLYGVGDALFGPAFNGGLSKASPPETQGQIQGTSQSIQALARVIGPLLGAQVYPLLQHSGLGLLGFFFLIGSLIISFYLPVRQLGHIPSFLAKKESL